MLARTPELVTLREVSLQLTRGPCWAFRAGLPIPHARVGQAIMLVLEAVINEAEAALVDALGSLTAGAGLSGAEGETA